MFISSGSLVITMKPKAKEEFCTAAFFLFYVLLKYYLNKREVLPYIISEPKVSTNVSCTPQAEASTMLLFLTAGNEKLWLWGILQWYNIHAKFWENE
jgi:hypothetical protein